MSELEDTTDSPFHPNNVGAFNLIVQMRNYDVLMAILNRLEEDYELRTHEKLNPKTADLIYDAHARGQIISDLPSFVPPNGDQSSEGEDNV